MRLVELIDARLGGLAASERLLLEVVAVGAPIESGLLDAGEMAALETLESREIVARRVDGRRRSVDVAHPLHSEVIRTGLARTRLEAIQDRLADGVEASGSRRRGDVLRVADWRLQSGAADPALFVRAAGHALAALDAVLAERLARAAVQAGGGFGARLALGRALAIAGQAQEAGQVLEELEGQAADDRQRAAVAIASARNLFWGLVRPDDADATLQRAERAISDDGLRDELVALRVRLVAVQGRPLEALAAAAPLLREPGVREQAQLQAAAAAAEALLSCGRTAEAIALTETWLPIARRHRDELPLAEPLALDLRAFALRVAGRLVEATELAQQNYERALAWRSAHTTAVEAALLGFIWLARGRIRTALRLFRESAGLLRDADPVGMLPWALAGAGQAAAQAGEPELAREAVAEMERAPLGHKGLEAELGLARAWSAAAAGEHSRARVLALEASDLAQTVVAGWLHVSQTTLWRIETGQRRLTIDEIDGFARVLGLCTALRWTPQQPEVREDVEPFSRRSLLGAGARAAFGLSATTAPAAAGDIDPGLVEHWMKLLRVLGRHDAMCGPHDVLAPVRHSVDLIADHRQIARGELCIQLLHVESRWAWFASWLSNDTGDWPRRDFWTERALRLAQEAGDHDMVAWVLMWQSRWAAMRSDARRAIMLADAARRTPGTTDKIRGLCALKQAHGYALANDGASCERSLAEAYGLLDHGAHSDHLTLWDDRGRQNDSNPPYVLAEEARCWLCLRPPKAIPMLEDVLRLWPHDRPRGRGIWQARLALAYAAADDPECAATEGAKALDIARTTRSDLTVRELKRLDRRLAAYDVPAAAEFREAFAAL